MRCILRIVPSPSTWRKESTMPMYAKIAADAGDQYLAAIGQAQENILERGCRVHGVGACHPGSAARCGLSDAARDGRRELRIRAETLEAAAGLRREARCHDRNAHGVDHPKKRRPAEEQECVRRQLTEDTRSLLTLRPLLAQWPLVNAEAGPMSSRGLSNRSAVTGVSHSRAILYGLAVMPRRS